MLPFESRKDLYTKWIKYLRSGKFTQIESSLKGINQTYLAPGITRQTEGHCCVGVLCEVAMKNRKKYLAGADEIKIRRDRGGIVTEDKMMSHREDSSSDVQLVSSLADYWDLDFSVTHPINLAVGGFIHICYNLNDVEHWTFEQIADWAELQLNARLAAEGEE